MDTDSLRQARKQIEQEAMLRAFYRLLWESAHQDPRLPLEKCPILPVEEIRLQICDMLGIRRIAHKNADCGLRTVP